MKVAMVDPSAFTLPYDHCLAAALGGQGCQVMLVTGQGPQGPWTRATDYEKTEIFYQAAERLRAGRLRTYLKGCEHPFSMGGLVRFLQRWQPDVIHFQWLPFALVDRLFLRRLRKIAPLVLTVHDSEPFHGVPSSRFQLAGLTSAYKAFDRYVVHASQSREVLVERLRLSRDRVSIIPHGVFAYYREMVAPQKKPLPASDAEARKRILFFGAIKPYKGLDLLVEAYARLPEAAAKDTVLQIVGYPKMPIEPLRALAEHLGVTERVHWDLRFVEEEDVAAYFAQADVVALPYRRIDQSGVLMIAVAFGKPVVASRIGGLAEVLVDGVHGYLTDPEDVGSLAQALEWILADGEARSRMGKAVQSLAEGDLSWDSIAMRTARLYEELVNERL